MKKLILLITIALVLFLSEFEVYAEPIKPTTYANVSIKSIGGKQYFLQEADGNKKIIIKAPNDEEPVRVVS